jgi:dolichol kinase
MFRLLAFTAVLALAASASHSAMAGKRYTHNLCKAKTIQGTTVTFRCKLSQKCCFNQMTGQKSCVPKNAICF